MSSQGPPSAVSERWQELLDDADAIAAAADLSVTGVQSASTGGGYSPVYEMRETAADSGGVPTEFNAGSVTVSATVDVTYRATE